jgi:hypothetical protein
MTNFHLYILLFISVTGEDWISNKFNKEDTKWLENNGYIENYATHRYKLSDKGQQVVDCVVKKAGEI